MELIDHNQEYTRKMVPIKGRAKVKLFDVQALSRFDVSKASFTRELQAGFSRFHSSVSRKIVSMRIVVLTYLRPNIFPR